MGPIKEGDITTTVTAITAANITTTAPVITAANIIIVTPVITTANITISAPVPPSVENSTTSDKVIANNSVTTTSKNATGPVPTSIAATSNAAVSTTDKAMTSTPIAMILDNTSVPVTASTEATTSVPVTTTTKTTTRVPVTTSTEITISAPVTNTTKVVTTTQETTTSTRTTVPPTTTTTLETTVPVTTSPLPTTTTATSPITTTTPTNTTTSSTTTTTPGCDAIRAYCPGCGATTISVTGMRIVNGDAASENEYPHQVIVYPTILGRRYLCGGSIIKKRWILTAAHCFYDTSGRKAGQSDIEVGYGSIDIYSMTVVRARGFIVHENYDTFTQANDIGLIELPADLNYESNSAIRPICLAQESDIIDGIKAVATGWGTTSYSGSTVTRLREVALDVIPITQCARLAILPDDSSKVLCALTNYRDTCQGDSGGPLIAQICPNRWVQIGVVSYGEGCAQRDKPGVYTRVPAYRDWIDRNTGSSTTC